MADDRSPVWCENPEMGFPPTRRRGKLRLPSLIRGSPAIA